MYRVPSRLVVGAALMLGVALLSVPATGADDQPDPKMLKQAGEAVDKVAASIDTKDFATQAAAAAKANDIEYVMDQMKPRSKGGKGIGAAKAPEGVKDSIELAVIDFGTKKAPTADFLKKNKDDLIQMTHRTQAIAEIADNYKPPKPKPGANVANWKKYNKEVKEASKEMEDAIKAADPAKFKEAATKMNAACNNCHTDFRD